MADPEETAPEPAGDAEPAEEIDDTAFSFDIPAVPQGTTLKVPAPDGTDLYIKVPPNALAGDRMHMAKKDGKWGVTSLERLEAQANQDVNGGLQRRSEAEVQADLEDSYVVTVVLETTKGPITIRLVPSWAPKGVQRFLQLVTNRFFTDVAIYRAVPKFLVQFGVVNDPERTDKYEAIEDDFPRGIPIQEGMVCFAASGADTRNTTLCIFLGDYPQLGKNPWETPIGKVHPDSMQTLHSIYTGYGDMPQCGGKGPDPTKLAEQGNDYIKSDFPECDFVNQATWLS